MTESSGAGDQLPADEVWDAGELGCGELVIELRRRLNRLQPLQTMLLIAADAGAPSDIPAWCRMTGNPLQRAEHPNYLIQRKGD